MATCFVPTHVRSATPVVETDHERTITERDAFARFADCVADFDVSSVDLHPDHAQQAPAQTLVAPETATRTKSPLARVRGAYRDSVMSVPHYDEEYDDSLLESLTGEFSPEVAAAVLTNDQLTPHLRDRLIDATHQARESRHALLQGLNNERTALEATNENLTRLGADLDDVLSAQSFHTWTGEELATARECIHARQQECDQLAADRQATLQKQRIPSTHHIDHEFTQYLYESLPVTYPVLTDITSLVGTLRTAQHGVERALNARNSEP
ncbi:DUF7260 family protein [Halococcus salifodinae]|uniref:DUF7260 domain-containing protein n=2 Tax=Halococcus salifodinae TaxID=36738 RepID=M0NA61_9EURY|nr:hypothetical protein C450_04883 [Halococcus salifodinae DSM 8989]